MKTPLSAGLAATLLCCTALAQSWPAKPVRIVVPFPVGGATDITAREFGRKITENSGHAVVIDNRPGAGGIIATELVAKATPDGHTLLMATNSTHSIGPLLYQKLPYDTVRDFSPIAHVANSPSILLLGHHVPATSVRELIALAKSKPGQLQYGSSGNGTILHLTGELFRSMAGIDLVHLPYKGTAAPTLDMISGRIAMVVDSTITGLPQVRGGKVKGIAVTGSTRSPLATEIPTVAESGLPGYEAIVWYGLIAPAKTPTDVVNRANAELNRIARTADLKDRITSQGAEPVAISVAQFEQLIRQESAKWAKVIREAGVKLE